VIEKIDALLAGTAKETPQDESQATTFGGRKPEDGRIDWNRPAPEIFNRMRGFAPWPGAYTTFRGQTCHLWGEPVSKGVDEGASPGAAGAAPGTMLGEKNEWFVCCRDATVLRVLSVKLEGRKQVSASEFASGARLKTGERFGDT